MWHGDKRAVDIGKLEQELEKRRVVLGFAAHRNDNGVNFVFLEIWIVNHRCLKALGRITEMGNELRASADRHGIFLFSKLFSKSSILAKPR